MINLKMTERFLRLKPLEISRLFVNPAVMA